jgi:hypothetical protein
MAAGIPVVSSDAGGLKEIVQHGVTGTTSFANDPASLAWGIRHALGDALHTREMAAKARERLETDFHWANLADQTIAVYDRVWREFLDSYWAENTVWPVSPGAEERYQKMALREKAQAVQSVARPMPRHTITTTPEAEEEDVIAQMIEP